jgi:FKBP-type peptidyl-prolyl cis-trans isomerase SlyD
MGKTGGIMRYVFAALMAASLIVLGSADATAAGAAIHNGSKVAFDYTLTVDGKVVDTSEGRAPLAYTQGDGKMVPGLARQMEGLKAGDERNIVVTPAEAYGEPDPSAMREVQLSRLPKDPKPEVGMLLQLQNRQGQVFPARIAEIKKDTAVIDLNHPLAGKTLNFRIKVVSVT